MMYFTTETTHSVFQFALSNFTENPHPHTHNTHYNTLNAVLSKAFISAIRFSLCPLAVIRLMLA